MCNNNDLLTAFLQSSSTSATDFYYKAKKYRNQGFHGQYRKFIHPLYGEGARDI